MQGKGWGYKVKVKISKYSNCYSFGLTSILDSVFS